jgi:hypothetical protein
MCMHMAKRNIYAKICPVKFNVLLKVVVQVLRTRACSVAKLRQVCRREEKENELSGQYCQYLRP